MKRIISLFLCTVMLICTLAGCSQGAKIDSVWDVMQASLQEEKYMVSMDLDCTINKNKVSISMEEECDGNATTLSASVTIGGISMVFKKVAIITDDVIYLKVSAILDALSPIAKLANVSLKNFNADTEWICLKATGAFSKDNTLISCILSSCEEAFSTYMSKDANEDGVYHLSCESYEDCNGVVESLITMLRNHVTDWTETGIEQYTNHQKGMKELQETYLIPALDLFVAAFEKQGVTFEKEQLDEIYATLKTGLDQNFDAESMKEQIEEAANNLESSLADFQPGSSDTYQFDFSGKKINSRYNFLLEAQMKTEEDKLKVSGNWNILVADVETVKIPDDSNVTDAMDYLTKISDDAVSAMLKLKDKIDELNIGEEGFDWSNFDWSKLNLSSNQ